MDAKIDQLTVLLQTAIDNHNFANPLSDDFSQDELLDFIKLNADNSDAGDLSKGEEMLHAILDLNYIYKTLREQIIEQLDEIGLNNSNIIKHVLSSFNLDYCTAHQLSFEKVIDKRKSLIMSAAELGEKEITNIFGQTGLISDAIEVSVDVCNELFSVLKELGDLEEDANDGPRDEQQLYNEMRTLMFALNYLVNLKEAFRYIKHESGSICRDGGDIVFKHDPEYYYLMRLIGKDRDRNIKYESFYYTSRLHRAKIKIAGVIINESNTLTFSGESDLPFTCQQNPDVQATTFYQHFEGYRFAKLKNIEINDILKLLSYLQAPFQMFDPNSVIEKTVKDQDLKHVPFKIEKVKLIQFLKQTTKLSEHVIQPILSVITKDSHENVDLWRYPLMSSGKYYYYALTSMAQGHVNYWADQVISKLIAHGAHEKLFQSFLKKQIQDWDCRYKVTVIDTSGLKCKGNFLVILFGSKCLMIEPCIYPYTLSSKDYRDALDLLHTSGSRLGERLPLVREELSRLGIDAASDIQGIIIPNYPLLSGLGMEGFPILDFIAFKNYFTIGEFRRSTLKFNSVYPDTPILSSYTYYNNEEEFGANFMNFAFNCPLITEKIRSHKIRPFTISFPESKPRVLRDGTETIKLEDSVNEDIYELDRCLKQMFYFGEELERKEELKGIKKASEKTIEFLLPVVMNYVALDRTDRLARYNLLNVFKNSKVIGLSSLIYGLDRQLSKLSGRPIRKKRSEDQTSTCYDTSGELMKRFLSLNMTKGIQISLSTWETKHDFTEQERAALLSTLETALGSIYQKRYSEEQLDDFLLPLITYVKVAGNDMKYRAAQHAALINFVDLLNYNQYFQKARDFSEEILEFSFRNFDHATVGWHALFKCFLKQYNVFDATFYGNLFFTSLITIDDIEEEEVFDAVYNLMLFARQFGYDDMLESTFLMLKSFPMNSYDKQKITLSYFNSKLKDPVEFNKSREEILYFVSENKDSIRQMANYTVVPWIIFLYNIQRLIGKELTVPVDELDGFISFFESEIPQEEIDHLRALVFPDKSSKKLFFAALVRANETRQLDDFVSESSSLILLANQTFLHSIEPLDVDSLILSGLVLNDNRLTFQNLEPTGNTTPFSINKENELTNTLKGYAPNILKGIKLKQYQELLWLVEVEDVVYCVRLLSTGKIGVEKLILWDKERQEKWLKKYSGFAFDDKPDFPINVQEGKYVEILNDLAYAKINITPGTKELLVAYSISMANFPSNFLQSVNESDNSLALHEDRVKEAIEKNENNDFISYHLPVSNIISWEWFSSNGNEVSIGSATQFTIQAWVPTGDGDFVLEMGNEKLKPLIKKYNGSISNDLVPLAPLDAKVNVFMAHGGKGFEGFRGVYSSHDSGHAYLQDKDRMKKIFGTGEIAVLFICSSALTSREIYAQRLISFTSDILSLGYKAVIAPVWDLNASIPSHWLEKFLECLHTGTSSSEAAHLANVYVSKYGFAPYTGFYYPAGWAAMHYFGNPNLSIANFPIEN